MSTNHPTSAQLPERLGIDIDGVGVGAPGSPRRRAYHQQWYRKNKERILARQRQPERRAVIRHYYNTRYSARYRIPRLAKQYGLTHEATAALLAIKNCGICGSESQLNIDHDHATGRVRGRLCTNCNNGLGRFKDNPATLRAAAEYLEHVRN